MSEFTGADLVAQDSQGNIAPGAIAKIYAMPIGNSQPSITGTLGGSTLTGGIVTANAAGRWNFFTVDPYDVVWVQPPGSPLPPRYPVQSVEAKRIEAVKYTVVQTLSDSQKAVARGNIDVPSEQDLTDLGESFDADLAVKYTTPDITDLQPMRPQFAAQFDKFGGATIMQDLAREPITGEWYVSQAVAGSGGSIESTRINRMSPQGGLISTMLCTWAGHGTTIDIEREGDDVWIWMSWPNTSVDGVTITSHSLVRTRYQDNVTVVRGDFTNVEEIEIFTANYTMIKFDRENDWMYVREAAGLNETFYRRKISDVEAGVNQLYGQTGSFTLADAGMQGFAGYRDYIYRYIGSSGIPGRIDVYSLLDGDLVYSKDVSKIGFMPNGVELGGFIEQEGISLFRDPSGNHSIIVGVAMGPSGQRTMRAYSLGLTPPPDAAERALITATFNNDMTAWAIPNDVTTLAAITRPGWYYLPTTALGVLTDLPADSGTGSALFLEVSPRNSISNVVMQKLHRVTVVSLSTMKSWYRTVDFTTPAVSPWYSENSIIELAATGLITFDDSDWTEAFPTSLDQISYVRAGRSHMLSGIIKTGVTRALTTSNLAVATIANALYVTPRRHQSYHGASGTGVGYRLILLNTGVINIQRGAGTVTTLAVNDFIPFSFQWVA